jgi:hypothetical protein
MELLRVNQAIMSLTEAAALGSHSPPPSKAGNTVRDDMTRTEIQICVAGTDTQELGSKRTQADREKPLKEEVLCCIWLFTSSYPPLLALANSTWQPESTEFWEQQGSLGHVVLYHAEWGRRKEKNGFGSKP